MRVGGFPGDDARIWMTSLNEKNVPEQLINDLKEFYQLLNDVKNYPAREKHFSDLTKNIINEINKLGISDDSKKIVQNQIESLTKSLIDCSACYEKLIKGPRSREHLDPYLKAAQELSKNRQNFAKSVIQILKIDVKK